MDMVLFNLHFIISQRSNRQIQNALFESFTATLMCSRTMKCRLLHQLVLIMSSSDLKDISQQDNRANA